MGDFTVNEMLEMQKALQEKYKDKWETICPDTGKNKLLKNWWKKWPMF